MPNFIRTYISMKFRVFFILTLACAAGTLSATARQLCSHRQTSLRTAKAAIASPLLEDYDVKYVRLFLQLSNLNTSVAGSAITHAVVKNPSGLTAYAFELDTALSVDSILMSGNKYPLSSLTTLPNGVRIVSGLALPVGGSFIARIYYHGATPNGSGFFTRGLNHYALGGTDITFSLSDPNLAKDWWPCKQVLTDKIDSADITIFAPAGMRVGSNGQLAAVTPFAGGNQWDWKTRYPIDYYLISVAVAPYADHSQMLHFTDGTGDSMPVQHYIYDTATFLPAYGAAIDSTPYMVDYFSKLYGRYPFWKEKYGHCIAPLGGGMEHQTMTTLGAFTTPLIAHELGHQWWGDAVTYASWLDIWLSEGFASYTEQLYVEHFWGATAVKNYRTAVFNRVMGKANGSVIVSDTNDVYRIFDSRLTYDKGAAVAHMLRYIAPNDSVYFAGLRAYQQRYAYKLATTDSFRAIMEGVYGRKLDTFFNQWVYKEGYPTYGGSWNGRGTDAYVQLTQTTSVPASVGAFALPLVLQLRSPAGDTLVKVYMNTGQQTYRFTWSNAATMTGFVVDPNNDVVNKTSTIVNDRALSVAPSSRAAGRLTIYPNPATDGWQLSGIPQGATLRLLDAGGRLVWQRADAPASIALDSRLLPVGIYTLQVQSQDGLLAAYKLERR